MIHDLTRRRPEWRPSERAIGGGSRPGFLCDIGAGGLRRLHDVKLDRLPRRADFARWGVTCAPGWGSDASEFVRDYEENRTDAAAAAAEAAPLLPALEAVLTRTGLDITGFGGTASELLDRLGEVCSEAERRARWYPSNASQLGGALDKIAPLLRSRSIEFTRYRDTDRKRTRRVIVRCASEAVYDELRARFTGQRRAASGQPLV